MTPAITTRILGYRAFPVSILAFISFIAIFIALSVTDTLEDVPKRSDWGGLDVKEAGEDLRVITSHPHPYNSHANDAVRTYLLQRLRSITANHSHVHIVDDAHAAGVAWAHNGFGVYFEGTNILVKVDGVGDDVKFDAEVAAGSDTNINVSDADKHAILFSAHYDSVSTAPGATDDGMGVVTLLQLVKYFAERRGRRSAVFNVNNGEEDWLNGAHAFIEHPWSNLTETFLNLEGAAAGGRPILFRATSTAPLRSLKSHKLIPHPHANVLSADAFARGVIKSGTDYSVYGDAGMQGLDLAFYKGRARYHTKYDSVAFTVGGEKSLWSMMEVARGVGVGLLGGAGVEKKGAEIGPAPGMKGTGAPEEMKGKVTGAKVGDAPVYFDLFKSILIIFPLSSLLTYNIVSLIVGPILLIFFMVCESVILHKSESDDASSVSSSDDEDDEGEVHGPGRSYGATSHRNGTGNGNGNGHRRPVRSGTTGGYDIATALADDDDDDDAGTPRRNVRKRRGAGWKAVFGRVWMHLKFWFSLGGSVGVLALWVWGVVVINPYAIYASPYLILLSALSLVFLVQTYILAIPYSLPFYSSTFSTPTPGSSSMRHHLTPHQQSKHTTFHHLYIFTWILLVLSTLGITKVHPGIASGYLITVWNTLVGIACVFCAVESGVEWGRKARRGEDDSGDSDSDEEEDVYDELEGADGARRHTHRHAVGAATPHDERAPLLRNESAGLAVPGPSRHVSAHPHDQRQRAKEREGISTIWWLPEFLISVPIPVVLFGSVGMVVLDGMPQSIVDGGSVWGVYILTALISLLLILPLSPFSTKLSACRPLTYLVTGLFVLSTLMTYLSFPFTVEDPLKVFFQQKIELSAGVVKIRSTYNSTNGSYFSPNPIHIPAPPPPVEALITSSLSGPKRYLRDRIVGVMPSAQHEMRKGVKGSGVWCGDDEVKNGLERCEWKVQAHMGLDTGDRVGSIQERGDVDQVTTNAAKRMWGPNEYFEAEIVRTGPSNATFRVKGRNTRNCRIYFDAPVFAFGVRQTPDVVTVLKQGMQRGYDIPSQGIKEIRLWGREWEKEWVVDVNWGYQVAGDAAPSASSTSTVPLAELGGPSETMSGMNGRIACEWVEYESGMVDTGPGVHHNSHSNVQLTSTTKKPKSHPKIPAFEEVLSFLPEWAAVSKYTDGLVEVWAPFEI